MMNVFELHPRTLIRKALVLLLEKKMAECDYPLSIYSNRISAFLTDELPAIGVYLLQEDKVENGKRPDPDERSLNVVIDVVVRESLQIDDELDVFTCLFEGLINLESVESEIDAFFKKDEHGESKVDKADFWILSVAYEGLEFGMASDEARTVGCATLSFSINYEMPNRVILPNFESFKMGLDMGNIGENGQGSDGRLDIEIQETFTTKDD